MPSDSDRRRVLLIGWDAADWRFIDGLIDRGLMPTLAALRNRSAWGNLSTIQPALSPMLWTSIATGKRPSKHRILGFVEPLPAGDGVRPAASTSRRSKAIWNIASDNGRRCNVVSWYASHPAEPIEGCVVTNQFEIPTRQNGKDWPVPADSVHPASFAKELSSLRLHPAEVDASAILPFVPQAATVDQTSDPRLGKLRQLIAQSASVHAVATHLLETTDWDLTCVYYEGIDRFGHEFMQYHPPAMNGVSARDVELYQDVMTGCYRWFDMMLERLLELAGSETNILLVSDHGYFHDARRPRVDADPQTWHRSHGIAVLAGPDVRAGERLYGATVLDVAPTVLAMLGIAPARDMDGRVWAELLKEPPLEAIASWESSDNSTPNPGTPKTPDLSESTDSARAAMQQLIDLGYIDSTAASGAAAAEQAVALMRNNLAISLLDEGRPADAAEIFDSLAKLYPREVSLLVQRAMSHAAAGNATAARSAAEALAAVAPEHPRSHLVLGSLELAEGKVDSALSHFRAAERCAPQEPGVQCRIGQVMLLSKQLDAAESAFAIAVTLDPDLAVAHDGLAEVALSRGEFSKAEKHALDAVGLAHFLPRAHFHLAQALRGSGKRQEAIAAAKMCLHLMPAYTEARVMLAALYAATGEVELAIAHRSALDPHTK